MIERLPAVEIEGHRPTTTGNEAHPMRMMTRRVAGLEEGVWDAQSQADVAGVFDTLAPEWHTRVSPLRTRVVTDAFERGVDVMSTANSLALEVGSGIGTYTAVVASRYERVVSIDLSYEMLAHAPPDSHRTMADGALLPVRSSTVDAVVLINAFVFPNEVARVLEIGGLVVWVNSSGPDTPIHLTTDDLVRALHFEVEGVESRAGVGTWAVLRRL